LSKNKRLKIGKEMTLFKKTINGVAYQTTQLGASRQLKLLPVVLRFISGPLGLLATQLTPDKIKEIKAAVEAKDESKAVSMLNIDGASLTSLVLGVADLLEKDSDAIFDLLEDTFAIQAGKPVNLGDPAGFDIVFNGRFVDLVKVLIWVGQINFAGFSGSDTPRNVSETQPKRSARH